MKYSLILLFCTAGFLAFANEPPIIQATQEEQQLLAHKGFFQRQKEEKIDGVLVSKGEAVFLVDAPTDVVWSTITSFAEYPKWISRLKETTVYQVPNQTTEDLFVKFKLSVWPLSWIYFVRHHVKKENGWIKWDLDPNQKSELNTAGYWRVDAEGSKSRVTYAVELKLGKLPKFVKRVLVEKGLSEATGWLKPNAERIYKESANTKIQS